MAFGSKKEIETMLEKGEFECLLCPHIETDIDYLLSEKGTSCSKCNNSLYYWSHEETNIFEASVNYNNQKRIFETTFQKR
ncbi:MAG: hypothetical protein AABW90_03545 [Nanoarchaeota archaeon]